MPNSEWVLAEILTESQPDGTDRVDIKLVRHAGGEALDYWASMEKTFAETVAKLENDSPVLVAERRLKASLAGTQTEIDAAQGRVDELKAKRQQLLEAGDLNLTAVEREIDKGIHERDKLQERADSLTEIVAGKKSACHQARLTALTAATNDLHTKLRAEADAAEKAIAPDFSMLDKVIVARTKLDCLRHQSATMHQRILHS